MLKTAIFLIIVNANNNVTAVQMPNENICQMSRIAIKGQLAPIGSRPKMTCVKIGEGAIAVIPPWPAAQ